MIDISTYQQRLEWLKEWINKKIDGLLPNDIMQVNIEQLMTYTPEQIIRIYYQTGILFTNQFPRITSVTRAMNFDEYCKYKQLLSKP